MFLYDEPKSGMMKYSFSGTKELAGDFEQGSVVEILGEFENEEYDSGLAFIIFNGTDVHSFDSDLVEVL